MLWQRPWRHSGSGQRTSVVDVRVFDTPRDRRRDFALEAMILPDLHVVQVAARHKVAKGASFKSTGQRAEVSQGHFFSYESLRRPHTGSILFETGNWSSPNKW